MEIGVGQLDEGGNRRNHPNATSIARKVLGMDAMLGPQDKI